MNVSDERLSASAIRYLNKQLAPQGLRVCRECQGHPLPLDGEHFYRSRGYFSHTCKVCDSARETERAVTRYRADEAVRQRKQETGKAWREAHLEQHKAGCRAAAARHRQQSKAAAFAAVLALCGRDAGEPSHD